VGQFQLWRPFLRFLPVPKQKITFKYSFGEDQVPDWLIGEFAILGINFQNWMPIAFAIVLLAILYAWIQE